MNLSNELRIGWRAISANKMRLVLTLLGIIIGIAAVVLLVSLTEGIGSGMVDGIEEAVGSNLVWVYPGAITEKGVTTRVGSARTLTIDDAKAIDDLPYVAGVAPTSQTSVQVSAVGKNIYTTMQGVTPEFSSVRSFPVVDGRFISFHDLEVKDKVCVLGDYVAKEVFGGADPVGEMVRVGIQTITTSEGRSGSGVVGVKTEVKSRHLKVIGVLEKKGGGGENSPDNVILVPITTMESRLKPMRTPKGEDRVSMIWVEASGRDKMDVVKKEIPPLLRERHRLREDEDDDFVVDNMAQVLDTISQSMGMLSVLAGFIAGISLLVGGIGIMNIMLVSVTERTREIGIRKAVGAKRKNILSQFLIESLLIGVLGGIIGIIVGWGGVVLLSMGFSHTKVMGLSIPVTLSTSPVVIVIAFVVSVGIGIIAGIYPAFRAARLNPVEAIRYE
jgi:putative ABC transport system permease protein